MQGFPGCFGRFLVHPYACRDVLFRGSLAWLYELSFGRRAWVGSCPRVPWFRRGGSVQRAGKRGLVCRGALRQRCLRQRCAEVGLGLLNQTRDREKARGDVFGVLDLWAGWQGGE